MENSMDEHNHHIEEKPAAILDPERQALAKEYGKIRRRLMIIDLALAAALLLAWILTGWSVMLRDWIFSWTQSPWLAVLAYGGVFGGVFTLLDLPLSFYSGYILPHRYQQSNQTLRGWIGDLAKNLLITSFLGAGLLEVIYLVLRTAPDTWWLWTAGILLIVNVLLANLAPVLLFPLFYKFTPLEEGHQELVERLMALADRSGAKVAGVYRFDMSRRTKSANAGLTGLGNTRRIILGDTLLEEFTPAEIETVLAHELGHQKNNDIPIGMAVQSLLTLGGLYLASRGLMWGVDLLGYNSPADIAALPLFAVLMGMYGLITMPLGNAFSRWREYKADDFALEVTGNGIDYQSALIRLGNQNLAEVDPEPWVELLLYSHPSLQKRVQRAAAYQSENK